MVDYMKLSEEAQGCVADIRSLQYCIDNVTDLAELQLVGKQLTEVLAQTVDRYQMLSARAAKAQLSAPLPEIEAPVEEATEASIYDGIYTVKFDDGTHTTLKFKTQPDDHNFMPGKQVASYLNGPDNWSNYQAFGTIQQGRLVKFRKYEGLLSRQGAAVMILLESHDEQIDGLKGYGMMSGKCGICSKRLTNPESLERGIGPECASKVGL